MTGRSKLNEVSRLGSGSLFACGVVAILAGTSPSNAQLNDAGTFKNLLYNQTGSSTVAFGFAFFNAEALFTNAGDYSSAMVTYPGPGSPDTLTLVSPTEFSEGPSFATQAAMDAAYPFGTYLISLGAGVQPATSVTLDYNLDAYTSDLPQLTAASFNSLHGLSTGLSSLTLNFNSFTPSPDAQFGLTYFTIFGSNQGCAALVNTSTSCTIDPQDLTPGTTYSWELDFSDRIQQTQGGVLTYTNFDVRTDGTFTTAVVPEPSTWAMLLTGFACLGLAAYRGSRKAVSVAA
jgi:hypothetical protein